MPLEFDSELERYSIPGAYFLPPTNLSAEEALSIIALCQELGAAGGLPFYTAAQRAAAKLEGSLPARMREELGPLTRTVRIRLDSRGHADDQASSYEQLVDAVARRQAVRIHYAAPNDPTPIVTKLRPYQLLFSRRAWYVIGRSSVHRQTRTFHVGRIERIEPTDDQFVIPSGFSIERYLRNAWHLIPGPGPDQKVVVRFQPMVAQNVAEVAWHRTQACQFNDDDTLDFAVTVSGLKEMSWWILGYGDQAEVLEPVEMRDLVAQHARNMLAKYEA